MLRDQYVEKANRGAEISLTTYEAFIGANTVFRSNCADDLNKHLISEFHLTEKRYHDLVKHVEQRVSGIQRDFIRGLEEDRIAEQNDPSLIEDDAPITLETINRWKKLSPKEFWFIWN